MELPANAESCTPNNTTCVTREDILNFPFPYKLWLVVNLDYCEFIRWNRDGTVILLDLAPLEIYLNSTRSIFRIKNRSVFLQHLEEFKFERLNVYPEAEEDCLLQYRHENFQRHRMDLLAKVRRFSYEVIGDNADNSKSSSVPKSSSVKNLAAQRMLGDLCFMSHGCLSKILKSRLRFQTVFSFQNESRILRDKLKASDERAAMRRRTKAGTSRSAMAPQDDDQIIEVSADLFENPHDSVLSLGEDFRPEYAGYYGNCSKEVIVSFFGEYLPMYEEGSTEIRKIIAEYSTTNNIANNNNNNVTTSNGHSDSSKINPYNEQLVAYPELNSTIDDFQSTSNVNPNFSSSLEPIFRTEEEEPETISYNGTNLLLFPQNNQNADADTDIAMEEFIKFKDPLALDNNHDAVQQIEDETENIKDTAIEEEITEASTQEKERFPQMPADVKFEIEQDNSVENEANFRNFFSQYRASLNLLYERH